MLDSLPVGCGKVNIANEQKARLPHRTKCLFSLSGDHSVQLLMGSFSETLIETQRNRRFVSSQQWKLESSVAESSVGSMQRRECPATSGNVFFGRMVATPPHVNLMVRMVRVQHQTSFETQPNCRLSCDSIRPVAEFDDGYGGVLLCRFKRFESSETELVR